jgi:hypothetical protein
LESSACRRGCGCVLHIFGFPHGRRPLENTEAFPKWWGTLDVGLAFVLAILVFVIMGIAHRNVDMQAKDATYRTYRVLNHGILAMGVVVMLFGDRIIWLNCVTGFMWRTWLLVYCLPWWFTALRPRDSKAQ